MSNRVVQKPVNANPGSNEEEGEDTFNVNRSMNFSCIKLFFTSYVLSCLRLGSKLKDKQPGQTKTYNLPEEKQIEIAEYLNKQV